MESGPMKVHPLNGCSMTNTSIVDTAIATASR